MSNKKPVLITMLGKPENIPTLSAILKEVALQLVKELDAARETLRQLSGKQKRKRPSGVRFWLEYSDSYRTQSYRHRQRHYCPRNPKYSKNRRYR